jgi:uncharacterized membrane protein
MEGDERPELPDRVGPPWAFQGRDLSRILALSDGVFAFAMTLLVLGLTLPIATQGGAVGAYLESGTFQTALFAYILTFFVIGLWWQGHHLIFGYIRKYDRPLVRANAIFLMTIAILPFATIVLNAAGSYPSGVAFFCLNQAASGISLAALWWYASGSGKLVAATFPDGWKTYLTRHTLVTPVVFLVSIPVAVFYNVTAGELLWIAVFVIPFVLRRIARTNESDPLPW